MIPSKADALESCLVDPAQSAPADPIARGDELVIGQACSSESAGSAGVAVPQGGSLAALLSGHVLRDGEIVLMALKPSLWFVVFQSLPFAAGVSLAYMVTKVGRDSLPLRNSIVYWEAAIFLVAGRLMWAMLQWMARWYLLTDQRVIRISGVFSPAIFSCPLRKVSRTLLSYSIKERACRLGSIEIHPTGETEDEKIPGIWQTLRRPVEVHEHMVAAIRRAQNGQG